MFKPHYWYHGNRAMPSEKLNDIFSFVNKTDVRKLLDDEKNHLTTYFAEDESLSVFFKDFYNEIGTQIMKNIGLDSVTEIEVEYWSQIYSKLMNHTCHNHNDFEGDDNAQLSWVHFVKVPEQKCFRFTDSEGNNSFYPDEQNNGDIIYFPSWAYHQVDPNCSDDLRVVIAGNITVIDFFD